MKRRAFLAGLLASTAAVGLPGPRLDPVRTYRDEIMAAFEARQAYLVTNPPLIVSEAVFDALSLQPGAMAFATRFAGAPIETPPILLVGDDIWTDA